MPHDAAKRYTVSLTRALSYDRDLIRSAMARAISLLQAPHTLIKPGMRVLLKPNLLSSHHPDKAITTHPEVIRAVIEIVKDCGATPFIGDSPCTRRNSIEFLWKITGVEDVCKETGAIPINFESAGTLKVRNGKPPLLASRILDQVDLVISLPKFKTHTLTIISCAIKNLFGLVPGYLKTYLHKVNPTPRQISEVLVDILEFVRPALTVVDAVVGLEGDGPGPSGTPRQVGLLIAGTNAVAVDTVCCYLMGIAPETVRMIELAHARGLGPMRVQEIEILGERLKEVVPPVFRLPRAALARSLSDRLSWLIKRISLLRHVSDGVSKVIQPIFWIRPRFIENCIGCGECVSNCPVHAISLSNRKAMLNEQKCIECMCCVEVCPQKAIELHGSFLARRLL